MSNCEIFIDVNVLIVYEVSNSCYRHSLPLNVNLECQIFEVKQKRPSLILIIYNQVSKRNTSI